MDLEIIGDFKLRTEEINSRTKSYYLVSDVVCVRSNLGYQEKKMELQISEDEYNQLKNQLNESGGFSRLCIHGNLEIKTRIIC